MNAATLKRNAYIYFGITIIEHLDPKIVLSHICQILRLVNKTTTQYTISTGAEPVVDPRNATLY